MTSRKFAGTSQTAAKVVIGIATTGRPGIVKDTLLQIATLDDLPDAVLLSIADASDFDFATLGPVPFHLDVITAPKGSCNQRNALVDAVDDTTILLFLDDDFLVSDGFISATLQTFVESEDIVMATDDVIMTRKMSS